MSSGKVNFRLMHKADHSGKTWNEMPLTIELSDGWIASYTIDSEDGRPVVSELRIHRKDGDQIPTGGLTTRTLRTVEIHKHIAEARDVLRWHYELGGKRALEIMKRFGFTEAAIKGRPLAKNAKARDYYYVKLALTYVNALESGSQTPTVEVAKKFRLDSTRATELIHKARKRGLLTPSPKGKAGGQLTDEAFALLEQIGAEEKTKSEKKK